VGFEDATAFPESRIRGQRWTRRDDDADGYTNIEEHLHQLVGCAAGSNPGEGGGARVEGARREARPARAEVRQTMEVVLLERKEPR
jgi:hypothetical protein